MGSPEESGANPPPATRVMSFPSLSQSMHRVGATADPSAPAASATARLAVALYGAARWPTPMPTELLAALDRLAEARRPKELLPLGGEPAELALERRGEQVLVSLYPLQEESAPWLLGRPVSLHALRLQAVEAVRAEAERRGEVARQVAERLAERSLGSPLRPEPWQWPPGRTLRVDRTPPEASPIAFACEAFVQPLPRLASEGALRADRHALLFEGRLEGWLRERRVDLGTASLLPRLEALLAVADLGLQAELEGRAVQLRRRACGMEVRLSRSRSGEVRFGLAGPGEPLVQVQLRHLRDAAAAIEALLSAVLRAVVAADRSQARNLRVRSLRSRLRALRAGLRSSAQVRLVRNDNPERLQWREPPGTSSDDGEGGPALGVLRLGARTMRYRERWRLQLDGLDAARTWLCGELLVASTVGHQVAVDRTDGQVRWARQGSPWTAVRGEVLLRQEPGGLLELCSLLDGEPFAEVALPQPVRRAWWRGLAGLPPVLVVLDERGGLTGIDPRTAEVRWSRPRLAARGHVTLHGRALLVAGPQGSLEALDVLDGETVWRSALPGIPAAAPLVVGETVLVSVRDGREQSLSAVGLWLGEERWRRALGGTAVRPLAGLGERAIVRLQEQGESSLAAVGCADGSLLWMRRDPAPEGDLALAGDLLVTSSPRGFVAGIETHDGAERWRRTLAEGDEEVPRSLAPVLRGGALFVPLGGVSLLRPDDGRLLGRFEVDAVADGLQVDDRAGLYVADESGLLVAATPGPVLGLVR